MSQPGDALRWPQGLAYGLLGLPLAFVALPLYVQLPAHYATRFGLPLASLGAMLLAVRALDAVVDPWIGRVVDRLLPQPRAVRLGWAGGAGALLVLAYGALFFPPVRASVALLAWASVALTLACLAYSALGVLHQAWGAALGGAPVYRARVAAWREGAALAGVLGASVLPALAGFDVAGALLAAAMLAGLVGLAVAPAPQGHGASAPGSAALFAPWRWPAFRRLMLAFMLNGVASALPATLVLFFIRDRLRWPEGEAWLLGVYFAAAAGSLPLWLRVIARIGLVRAWRAGMALAIAGFVGSALLGPGDAAWFLLVCAVTGAALGADLCAPSALLAGLLRHAPGLPADGVAFGWWTAANKLNLALAAGLALPLLQALGYQPGSHDAGALQALAAVYALLPCALKGLAWASLGSTHWKEHA